MNNERLSSESAADNNTVEFQFVLNQRPIPE